MREDDESILPKVTLADVPAAEAEPDHGERVGQGSVRLQVIGSVNRKATAEEIQRMKEIVAENMRDGAFGLSTGLFYDPGVFTPTEEVVELARVADGGLEQHRARQIDVTTERIVLRPLIVRAIPTAVKSAPKMGRAP